MSFVNKSTKKFAPKAQARARTRPAASSQEPTPTPTASASPVPIDRQQVEKTLAQSTARSSSDYAPIQGLSVTPAGAPTVVSLRAPVIDKSRATLEVATLSAEAPSARTAAASKSTPISTPVATPRGVPISTPSSSTAQPSTPITKPSLALPLPQPGAPVSKTGASISKPAPKTGTSTSRPGPSSTQPATVIPTPTIRIDIREGPSTARARNISAQRDTQSESEGPATKKRRVEKDKGIAIRIPGQQHTPQRSQQQQTPAPSQDLYPYPPLTGPSASESEAPSALGPAAKTAKKPRKKRARKDDTALPEGATAEQETPAKKRRGRPRQSTPENAEHAEIQTGIVKMQDLCKDTFIGKKSERYKEIEKIDWTEVVRQQRARQVEAAAAREEGRDSGIETVDQRLERLHRENGGNTGNVMLAPQMREVDGRMVLDESSLQIDRRERDAADETVLEVVEENSLTRRVNSATWSRRERTERWDVLETAKFYESLSMFGTDFEMISRMFQGRSRRQVKNKFVIEEKKNPGKVTEALKRKVAVNINEYSRLANKPISHTIIEDVEAELRKIREDHESQQEAQARQGSELARERNAAAAAAIAESSPGDALVNAPTKKKKGKNKVPFSRQEGSGEVILGTIG